MASSAFDLIMTQTGVPALLRVFGVDATYTNDAGQQIAVTVILRNQDASIGDYGQILESRLVASIARDSVSEPRRGDTLVCDGVTYLVDGILPDQSNSYLAVVALKADT